MEIVEDYRLVVVATARGWRTYAVLDDGVELIEDVSVLDHSDVR